MLLATRTAVLAAAVSAAAVFLSAPAGAADPNDWPTPGSQPADAIQAQLERMGYNVAVNWINNGKGVPLSRCQVSGIHAPGVATTAYLDVVCPDED